MRVFINRIDECKKFLKTLEIDEDCYFDQEYWLFESEESFHCEYSSDESMVKFFDHRLPSFEIPIEYIRIEK